MRNPIGALAVALLFIFIAGAAGAAPQNGVSAKPPLPWAYGFPEDGSTPPQNPACMLPKDDGSLRHVPGSSAAFTLTQISDCFGPADWFPEDHPAMPEVISHGRKPGVTACGLCHYPNGKGRPENAGVSGLPVAYFVQQMNDFKSGARKSAEPRKANTNRMIGFAKAMTDDEIKTAAEYFATMKWTTWIKVVETANVPKTRIAGGMFLALEGNETEPLGQRIIEVPVNAEETELLRNPRSSFIAYVPVGSIKKGEDLVMTGGGGKTTQCGICHGQNLEGLGPIPPLAGRSPSYMARQMYDIQHGTRNGPSALLMQNVVAKLTPDDIVAISAYLTSRTP
jgi:cytochrome c553